MTHGYHNIFGGGEDWTDLLTSGIAYIEAVAQDWVFGSPATLPPTPPTTGHAWSRHTSRARRQRDDDEEWLLLQ